MNDKKANIDAISSNSDGFSDVLRLLRLDVDIYHNAKVCGQWRIDEHTLGATCFHIVTLGSCYLEVPGYLDCQLDYGDLVIFPRELVHNMLPQNSLTGDQQHLDFVSSKNIQGTGLLCGEIRFQHTASQSLLDALPAVFIIRYAQSHYWLEALLKMIVYENNHPAAATKAIINHLSELLFTYAIRQYVTDNPDNAGMLAIYSHPRLAKVIQAIHQQPEKNWTLESMAKTALMSRSSFADFFKAASGWTAGQYLSWWRMQLAWSSLAAGESVSQVADKIGYQSEAAFSRAFQKMFATTAGDVRRGR